MLSQKRNLRDTNDGDSLSTKKPKTRTLDWGFRSFQAMEAVPLTVVRPEIVADSNNEKPTQIKRSCRQFWKAGDYEGDNENKSALCPVGIDHVRVHPKFLHSNATSHKWALGALAELLDNSLDEVCSGATYVHIDVMKNQKDKESSMLIIEDNGGGMDPEKIRQCMSLGYSAKSKMANTIGQYGNGFKTSTMRLGADALVFSRCKGTDGKSPTQSVGMLSYTFLRGTGKEDIVVPMLDFEKVGQRWNKMRRPSIDDWNRNLDTILQWSPYLSEEDLLKQFNFLNEQGTRIVIYNLWEDDHGKSELDFDTDLYDIQLRGVNRDEKNIETANKYPNSRHFLTYRHSLRSYASILYLRLPHNFRIILRGKDVEHHNIVNDMMMMEEITYKPQYTPEGQINQEMVAVLKLGFVKDAHHHIDVQGFNVYHKNRLIMPFWRLWNAAGSDGRGVIGVLEANFVEPAHDKQGFERTTVLSRLENRLIKIQKRYWSSKCQEVGYAPRRNLRKPNSPDKECMPSIKDKPASHSNQKGQKFKLLHEFVEDVDSAKASAASTEPERCPRSLGRTQMFRCSLSKDATVKKDRKDSAESDSEKLFETQKGNYDLRKRFDDTEEADQLQREKEGSKSLELQLKEAQTKIEEMENEHMVLIDMLQEEREQRQKTEEGLREKLRVASNTIDGLLERVKQLEARVRRGFN